jgi:hypothetical protein
MLRGDIVTGKFDQPYSKFAKEFEEYPWELDGHDNVTFPVIMDEFERRKPFSEKGEKLSKWVPDILTDDETVPQFIDLIGSSHDEDPPDSNLGPAADERMDEEEIWNFTKNSITKENVINEWSNPNGEVY